MDHPSSESEREAEVHEGSLRSTRVDLSGLMMVLGEHLYSTPLVAVRELVQNAHDSCRRRQLEDPAPFAPRIAVTADPAALTLSIEDSGAGLTADEIERYLATVGAGYTRTLRQAGEGGLIGFFGLGFLSAFVVADKVEVWTCSYQDPGRAHRFLSRSGHSYTIAPAEPRPVGTRVTLHLRPGFADLASHAALRGVLERYCCLLDFPVHCGDDLPAVNAAPPPWRDPAERSDLRQRRLALDFVQRFEPGFQPLCALPIRPSSDDTDVRGLLWIQDAGTYGSSDNRTVSVFVRGMLIGDDERDLLPRWAGFCGAVVESQRLLPTASREGLQKNQDHAAAQRAIRDALITGIGDLARHDPATWRRVVSRHNEALLGAAIADPRLFDLLADELTVPTSQGDLTLAAILQRSQGTVPVSQAERGGFEELIFRALQVPVVVGTRYGALPFCREYAARRRGRLIMLGTGEGDRELFRRAELPPADRERLVGWFGADGCEVVPARFAPPHLPFVVVPDREAELKARIESDRADARISGAVLGLARQFTRTIAARPALRVYINLESPAIAALLAAPPARAARAVGLLRPLLSLISESDDGGRIMPIDQALRTFGDAVVALLHGPDPKDT